MNHLLFLDTNIVLDLLGNRDPFYKAIAQVATLAEEGKCTLCTTATALATINYFLTKYETEEIAKSKIRKLRIVCSVIISDAECVDKALNSEFKDFEDALQYFSALNAGVNIIITRNGRDFKLSDMPVMTAEEYVASLG